MKLSFVTTSVTVLLLLVAGIICPPAISQIMRLPHPDTTRGNYFGTSVALDGPQAIVGASAEASCGENSGAAYVFALNDSTGYWVKQARLIPSNCESDLFFGRRVALHGDHALVASSRKYFAAEKHNTVYYYHRDSTGVWNEIQQLTIAHEAHEGVFGYGLALEQELAVLTTSGDVANNRYSGAAYIYELRDKQWTLVTRLSPSGRHQSGIFGGNVTLLDHHLAVASGGYFSQRSGSVHIFESDDTQTWTENAQISNIEDFFISVDGHDDEVLIGQSQAGTNKSGIATLYARDSTGTWRLTATLRPPTPYSDGAFGTEVALSGDRALVVGYDEQLRLDFNVDRVVYVYMRKNQQWHYQGIIDIGQVAFGTSVDLDGHTAIIGASSAAAPGAAYVIRIP